MQNARRPPKPTRKPPPVPQVEEHITNVVVPKIKELNKALKGHAKSYQIELQDNLNPLNHFTKTRPQTESHLEDLLKTMKGLKFIETLEVTVEKDTIDSKTGKRISTYKTAFFNGKAKTITKVDDIEPEINMFRQEILNTIDKWVSAGSGWVIDRIDSHYLKVTLYKPLSGSSYIKLPAKLFKTAFGFHIVNFPFMSRIFHQHQPMVSMHLSSFAMPVVAQVSLIFLIHHRALVKRLLSQGYKVNCLSNTFKKFYGRHTDLVGQYKKNVCQMFADSIS